MSIFNLPRPWAFAYHREDLPGTIMPTDNMGLVMSREEWLAIQEKVNQFYALATDEEIEAHNAHQNAKEEQYWKSRWEKGKPKPKRERRGYIYLLRSESGHYKVGKTTDPTNRNHTLNLQLPYRVTMIYTAEMLNMGKAEDTLHAALSQWHVNGEWFDPPLDTLQWILSGQWLDTCGLRSECMGEARHE